MRFTRPCQVTDEYSRKTNIGCGKSVGCTASVCATASLAPWLCQSPLINGQHQSRRAILQARATLRREYLSESLHGELADIGESSGFNKADSRRRVGFSLPNKGEVHAHDVRHFMRCYAVIGRVTAGAQCEAGGLPSVALSFEQFLSPVGMVLSLINAHFVGAKDEGKLVLDMIADGWRVDSLLKPPHLRIGVNGVIVSLHGLHEEEVKPLSCGGHAQDCALIGFAHHAQAREREGFKAAYGLIFELLAHLDGAKADAHDASHLCLRGRDEWVVATNNGAGDFPCVVFGSIGVGHAQPLRFPALASMRKFCAFRLSCLLHFAFRGQSPLLVYTFIIQQTMLHKACGPFSWNKTTKKGVKRG